MEKLPSDLPEKISSLEPTIPTEEPRLIRPSSGRIWFMAIMFFLPLLIMIIFAIIFISFGLGNR
ncbi:MAG: hypothetical protein J0I20_10235 [Chloroflexi bacterium]|nr:hypothetical protein [Chloroflexota bacterium]OJV94530.1 MAG: hypothetical protein BGO39_22575 [Chloroflexi bacterium 54-19]